MPVDFRKDKRYCHLTEEQVLKHFEVERSLAKTILRSSPQKRAATMLWAYDELFRQVPWHPALSEKSGMAAPQIIEMKLNTFLHLLPQSPALVLELGCGMGELAYGLVSKGFLAIGIDISQVRMQRLKDLPGARFVRADSVYLPFADNSFDVAISQQMFEHLHPEDAEVHLNEISRVLRKDGTYILETPNRLIGPGDVSRFFVDGEGQGFHLKEYTTSEMVGLFRQHGFTSVRVFVRGKLQRLVPEAYACFLEKLWSILPKFLRRRVNIGLHNPIYVAQK